MKLWELREELEKIPSDADSLEVFANGIKLNYIEYIRATGNTTIALTTDDPYEEI